MKSVHSHTHTASFQDTTILKHNKQKHRRALTDWEGAHCITLSVCAGLHRIGRDLVHIIIADNGLYTPVLHSRSSALLFTAMNVV